MNRSRYKFVLIVVAIGLVTTVAQAQRRGHSGFNKRGRYFAIDAGGHVTYMERRGVLSSNNESKSSPINAKARFRVALPLGKMFFFEPSFSLLLPWRSGSDGTTKTFTGQTDLDLTIPLFSFLRIRIGPGMQTLYYLTKEETVVLRNGTSTSNFYIPGNAKLSMILTAHGGLDFRLSRRFSLLLETHVLGLGSIERRDYNIATLVGYRL